MIHVPGFYKLKGDIMSHNWNGNRNFNNQNFKGNQRTNQIQEKALGGVTSSKSAVDEYKDIDSEVSKVISEISEEMPKQVDTENAIDNSSEEEISGVTELLKVDGYVYVVNCKKLNLRASPSEKVDSEKSNVIAKISFNEKLSVLKDLGEWLKVKHEETGSVGFVKKEFTEKRDRK